LEVFAHSEVETNDVLGNLLTYLLRPIAPGGVRAIKNPSPANSPANSNLSFSLSFFPVVSCLLQFRISVPSPAVSGASPLSLPLGFPPQNLPGDVVWCFPQGATNPAPFSSQNLFTDRLLFPSLPKLLIANFLRPQNVKDTSQAAIYESLYLQECLFCPPPRLRSTEENRFYVGIEDA